MRGCDVVIEKTESICPACKKAIGADIIERAGSVYMRKSCMEHGDFETRIAKYAWYYKGLNSFHDSLFSDDSIKPRRFDAHVLFLSSRCNLNCPICLTNANVTEEIKEISLDALEEELSKIRGQKKIIRLSGGEPTLREDLPQIIRLISRSGNIPFLFTNGIKLLDLKYLKELKKSGLSEISTWVETMKSDRVYEVIRGRKLLDIKKQVLENIRKAGIPFLFYHVKVKGVNDSDTADCLEYVRRNSFVEAMWVRSYTHLGKKGFSISDEFTIDELIENVAQQSRGLFTLEDVYNFQRFIYVVGAINNIPHSYLGQATILPRGGASRIRFFFNNSEILKLLDEFNLIWQENKNKAKKLFCRKMISRLMTHLPVLYLFIRKILTKNPQDDRYLPRSYFLVTFSKFYNLIDYDRKRIFRQSYTTGLDIDFNGVPFCQAVTEKFG